MFANLNLQLTTSTGSDGVPGQLHGDALVALPGEGTVPSFSQLMGLGRSDDYGNSYGDGGDLPLGGKDLPLLVSPMPVDSPLLASDSLRGDFLSASSAESPEHVSGPALDISIAVAYRSESPMSHTGPDCKQPGLDGVTLRPPTTDAPISAADSPRAAALDVSNPIRAFVTPAKVVATPQIQGQPATLATVVEMTPVATELVNGLRRDKAAQTKPEFLTSVNNAPPGTIKIADMPANAIVTANVRAHQLVEAPIRSRPSSTISSSAPLTSPVHLSTSVAAQVTELASARTPALNETINTPVRDAAWGEKLAERVLMFTGNQVKTAEIRLSPADLGPLRVQIGLDDGTANISFQAQHAVTREAIEQALPRLREMMADSGLSLGQTDVAEQGVADGKSEREANGTNAASTQDDAPDGSNEPDPEQQHRRKTRSLLDTFA